LAWDLRWQQQLIILSGTGAGDGAGDSAVQSISESEVWEVQYDRCIKSNTSSTRILPAMICSEDGILGVIEQGIYVHCNLQHVENHKSSGIYFILPP
jgi:nuclear pore complex protein Nup43